MSTRTRTTASTPASTPTPAAGFSGRRVLGLARFNLTLMLRNRTTLVYGLVMPLLPLLLLLTTSGDSDRGVATTVTSAWLVALLFPVYYNLLSMFVTRRDELVLKRLRTGEVRDLELIVSMALPGAAIGIVGALLAVPAVALSGGSMPTNALLLVVGLLAAVGTFAALAIWTASWTRTAEAAQLTSAPVMVLALVGTVVGVVPDSVARWLELTPGAAVADVVSVAWFGLESGQEEGTLSWGATFTEGALPIVVLLAWTVLAVVVARRSLRWEPRS